MASPVTLRLDEETRRRIVRVARLRGVSASTIIREAIRECLERQEETSPYKAIADLVGIVHGGNPGRATATGRRFREVLESRRGRRGPG